MSTRSLAFFFGSVVATSMLVVACDDKSDDDDDDDDDGNRTICHGGCETGGAWDWESGDWDWESGDAGNACDDDDHEDPSDTDSCDWSGLDVCFEFTGYDDTDRWCSDIGAVYSISTDYDSGDCPSGAVGQCDYPAAGDFPVPATAYYYAPSFDSRSAAEACASAGGS